MRSLILAALVLIVGGACATAQPPKPTAERPAMPTPSQNPLVKPWSGPYGGVPPFEAVKLAAFKPAFEEAMEITRAEIAAITAERAPATFENTMLPLERAGQVYERVETIFGLWSLSLSGPEFQAIERELAPKLSAFSDEITQNAALFERIAAVYKPEVQAKLTPEQQRLSWLTYTRFVRAGAKLDAPAKQRVIEINQRLATLFTQFSQNVLGDEEKYVVVLETEKDLAGLPMPERESASAAAETLGHKGKWIITNTRSSVEPFLTYSSRRDLREKVWRNFVNRGDNKDERDNNGVIKEILRLRFERAQLLGYETHAHWRVEDQMARTPDRAMDLLTTVWKPAAARVREEVADMQRIADRERPRVVIEPWDYRYYAEKVRKVKYDLNQNDVKPYLDLERLRDGMFWVAGELFGFNFSPIDGVPVFHPDVRVWEVKDKTSGRHVGVWYFDPYARAGKKSGAWMQAYRAQDRLDGEISTIVSNNANFVKGRPGERVLISWEDAETLFHEFGHALHGLASAVTYRSLSGTAVARDYVEFPSQLMERWLATPEVLERFALHHQTGKPIPESLVKKIHKADAFNQGFVTMEYLSSALIDLKLHLAGGVDIDPRAFERDTLAALGMPREIVMRHRTPQFGHVFGSDGYSSAYYSYLWADTLSADAFEAFLAAGSPYDPKTAARLAKFIFSVGNTRDPAEAYREFRGRDPGSDALMRKRGFPLEVRARADRP